MVSLNTLLVHGGKINDNLTGAVNVPIYNSSTYKYPKLKQNLHWDYERSGNPTREAVEKVCTELEDGDRGFAFASGMAAIQAALSLFKAGDHIIVGKDIYGGTFRLIDHFLKPNGISITPVDTSDLKAVSKAFKKNTRAIYFETVTNPLLQVTSVKKIARLAHRHKALVLVDNTFLSPYLQKPLQLGADLVIHSATKYLSGHSDLTAGIIVTKDKPLSDKVYLAQNAIGAVLAPQEANLLRRGIQTLGLRLDRHLENTKKVLRYLKVNPAVKKIYYPTIDSHSSAYTISKQETKAPGAVLSFELQDRYSSVSFVNALRLFTLACSLGSVESLVEVPAFMSHGEVPKAKRLQMGIKDNLIRLSIGIEDSQDIISDLRLAFSKVTRINIKTQRISIKD